MVSTASLWYGMVQLYIMVWHGMVQLYIMVWYGRHDITWYGMAWNEKTGEDCYLSLLFSQTLFKAVLSTIENGGKPVQLNAPTTVGYTKEQAEAIQRLKTAKDNYERLGLTAGASK